MASAMVAQRSSTLRAAAFLDRIHGIDRARDVGSIDPDPV